VVDDWYGFTLSFKGVVLEGLEVVFIALTFGSNQHDIPLAALAAVSAVVVVAVAGLAVRAPLSRVPENTMKFAVGVMLTAFGTFWGAEGAGAVWPGSDAALPFLVAAVAALGLGTSAVLRRNLHAHAIGAPWDRVSAIFLAFGTISLWEMTGGLPPRSWRASPSPTR
jgi:uncharacterized membrane protein